MDATIDDFLLDGQVALITGAAKGLGAKLSEPWLTQGAVVAITDVAINAGIRLAESRWITGTELSIDGGVMAN